MDMVRKANRFYRAGRKNKAFAYEDCFDILKDLQLFNYKQEDPIENVGDDNEGTNNTAHDTVTARPAYGRDAAKAKAASKRKSSAASSDHEYAETMRSVTSFHEGGKARFEAQEARQKQNSEALQELLQMRRTRMSSMSALSRIEQDKDDDKVMSKNVNDPNLDQRDYWLARQAKVRERWSLDRDDRYYE